MESSGSDGRVIVERWGGGSGSGGDNDGGRVVCRGGIQVLRR